MKEETAADPKYRSLYRKYFTDDTLVQGNWKTDQ